MSAPRSTLAVLSLCLAAVPVVATSGCAGRDPNLGEGEGEGEGEGDACGVTPPPSWSAPDFASHAAEALALRAQLDVLTGDVMRAAEEGTLTLEELTPMTDAFAAGDPSLADLSTAEGAALVSASFAELLEVLAAGPVTLVDAGGGWTPGAAGGLFGTSNRGINEGGLEPRQLVDKALFAGAAFYPYALSLTEGEISPATIEALAAIWGANELLDVDGTVVDGANYTKGMGFHGAAAAQLVAAHAYAADATCAVKRDAAVRSFFRIWEKAMLTRFAHYAHGAAASVAAATDDEGYADALHDLSEGIGLVAGFRGVAHPSAGPLAGAGRIVGDDALDALLEAVGVDIDDLGASTTGALLIETNFAAPLASVDAILAEALDVDADEVASWIAPEPG